jgi:hypothetical protein
MPEVSSGIHPIDGAPTGIAAFVGSAAQGPTDSGILLRSWSDFETQFGGFDPRFYLGYAVSHFFANGGQQAYVVRLPADGNGTAAVVAAVHLLDPTDSQSACRARRSRSRPDCAAADLLCRTQSLSDRRQRGRQYFCDITKRTG